MGTRKERKIVIGLDFGTTFTGVAYANSLMPDVISVIQEWPNHEGLRELTGKVPTKLCYQSDGSLVWGARISPDAPHDDVLEYFKLALDPDHIDKLQDGTNLTKKNLLGQDIDHLVTAYLAGVGDHVMEYLQLKLGTVVLDTIPVHLEVTVPAIWSEVAIQRTLNCLTRAWKMDSRPTWTVGTLTEPEAAAICVLQQMPSHGMKEGDGVMVVDAGGGTVDLITYRIGNLSSGIKVSEAVPGTGGACGSAFLNDRFDQLLANTLGQEDGFDGGVVQRATAKWDRHTKKTFTMASMEPGGPKQFFDIDVLGLADNRDLNIRGNKWRMPATEVFRIFDGVVLQILKLVNDQQAASQVEIKAIVLVGGFGQSTYLRERIQAHVGTGIRVLQPGNPGLPGNAWTSVVQGAVMRGLSKFVDDHGGGVIIENRRARKHFGFPVSTVFSNSLHRHIALKKRWDPYRGRDVVNVVQWFLRKGEPVTEREPYFRGFNIIDKVNEGRRNMFTCSIYSDKDSDVAPLDKTRNVKTLCVVQADLSHISDDEIPQKVGKDGFMYYVVDFELEIRHDAASTAYTLLHNGRRYDTVTAEYV